MITSTVTNWMMGEAMDAIESGSYGDGKVIEANIDNGGVYLGKFSDKVPADVQSKVEEYTEQIKPTPSSPMTRWSPSRAACRTARPPQRPHPHHPQRASRACGAPFVYRGLRGA